MKNAGKGGGLPLKTKLGFGVCDLGGNLYFTLIGFYLMFFLTDIVGLAPALAGTALLLGKIWDAVTDPAVGYLSDRTRSPWGRRRPYIFYGSLLLFIAMLLMFTSPGFASQGALFAWAALAFCVLGTAYTLVNIPYGSLLPELTSDFDERTTLAGFRMSFAVVGTLVGAGAVLPIVGLFSRTTIGWAVMGGSMGGVMTITAMITFFTVKEPGNPPATDSRNLLTTFLDALRNRVFLLALIPWVLHIGGVTVIQGALLYYFRYVYGNEGAFQIALVLLLVTALVFIPIWVMISRRIGKKLSYNIGMGIVAAAVLVFFVWGESGLTFAYVIMTLAGIGLSTNYVMPFAILPDIVEQDYAEQGTRREGIYYGLWTFGSKMGQAFAAALVGWILGAFGYVAGAEQTALARSGIKLLCGPIPALFFALGIVILSFYPITQRVYEQIRARIEEREAGGPT
jgi:GPH family glycoside/pentoside/hexuronide:cation symporter